MFLVWLRFAAVLYACASITAFPAVLYGRPRWGRFIVPLTLGGFFFHFVATAEMFSQAHSWIPVGPREVQSLLGLLIVAAFLLLNFLYKTVSFGIFALPMAVFLVFVPALAPDHYTFASATERTGWLMFHIATLLAAYAALIFSMLASALYLAQERRLKARNHSRLQTWLPPLATMDSIASLTLLIGFPCMTVGLLAGSLIAQESVGPAYFLDTKVLLSFVMWVLYVVLLFVRTNAHLRGRRAAYLSGAVFAMMITVLAANQLSQVHRFTP